MLKKLRHGAAERLMPFIRLVVARRLWIISQYDIDKLSVLKKASKHNAESTAVGIKVMTELERTNWVMPQLKPECFAPLQLFDRALDEGRGVNLSEAEQGARRTLRQALLQAPRLAVLSEKNHGCRHRGLPKDPVAVGVNPELKRARAFAEELKRAADEAATESSGGEEEEGEGASESSDGFDA